MAEAMRIGLAGAGMVSRHHLDGWAAIRGAKVVAIADPDRARAEARAGEYAIPAVHDSVETMLAQERLDAIDIATPMATHAALVACAADHGVAILCQKPLAPTLEEAEAVAAIAAQKSVRLMVHENWRFRPHYRTIATWLEEGRIGRPVAFHLETLSASLLPRADGTAPGLTPCGGRGHGHPHPHRRRGGRDGVCLHGRPRRPAAPVRQADGVGRDWQHPS
ncbi:MAG: Gfo/Idh/MocA family oxidoreductase [Pseudomonadota bacterium]